MYEQAGFFKGLGMWAARWVIVLGILGTVVFVGYQCFSPGAQADPVTEEEVMKTGPNKIEGWNELLDRLRGDG